MDKISILVNKAKINFGINKVKYLLGNNYNIKFDIINTIKKYFNKFENSEYAIENDLESNFKINDNDINFRKWQLLEISEHLDFTDELKLKSKSVFTKLLETQFYELAFSEIVSTINILNQDLAIEMNDSLNKFFYDDNITISFGDYDLKTMIKNIKVNLFKNNMIMNEYDLSYNNKIIMQILIARAVARKTLDKKYLVVLEIPTITKEIVDEIKKIKEQNISIIVASNDEKLKDINVNDVVYIGKNIIDLADEVEIYNKILLNLEKQSTIEEVLCNFNNYLNENEQNIDPKFLEII